MKTIVNAATAFSAVVFLVVPTASAIDTNSVSFNAGADLRVRQEIMGNVPGTPGGGMQSPVVRNKSKNQMRFRMRAWGDLKLGDHFRIYTRVTDEPRWNITPQHSRAYEFPDELVLDNLYFEGVGLFDDRIDFRFGRQDVWEPGMGFLFGLPHVFADGTPGDGSRTLYTDMMRMTWHVTEESKFDAFALYNSDRNKLRWGTGGSRNRSLNGLGGNDPDMDEFGAGLVWSSNIGGPEAVPYQLFTIFKKNYSYDVRDVKHPGKDLTVFGGRATPHITDELSLELEGMTQVGETTDGDFCNGWSGFAGIDWRPDLSAAVKPYAKFSVLYMSGDKDAAIQDGGHSAWDPLWSRGVEHSEMFLYGTLYGVGWWSNLIHPRLTLGSNFGKLHRLNLSSGPMFAAENDGLGHADGRRSGDFKGWITQARYDFPLLLAPENASGIRRFEIFGHLLAEFFNPGDYYDTQRPAWFVRWQIDVKF